MWSAVLQKSRSFSSSISLFFFNHKESFDGDQAEPPQLLLFILFPSESPSRWSRSSLVPHSQLVMPGGRGWGNKQKEQVTRSVSTCLVRVAKIRKCQAQWQSPLGRYLGADVMGSSPVFQARLVQGPAYTALEPTVWMERPGCTLQLFLCGTNTIVVSRSLGKTLCSGKLQLIFSSSQLLSQPCPLEYCCFTVRAKANELPADEV